MMLLERPPIKGKVFVEQWRGDRLIAKDEVRNGVTNQGKNYFLDAAFNNGTRYNSWYLGIINNAGFSALSSNDTPASHAGWVEYTTTPGSARATWGQGTASGQQITNASIITITLNNAGTLQGIFVISDSTKGGTIGILWATALFTTPLTCEAGDTLRLSYAIQL